ncbi:MAG: YoaK family protein [Ilumatobacteraceae bacterium]
MPAESTHHTSGTLPIAIALAASAGYVDAFIYQRVAPVFVANMSGNLIHLGIAAGEHSGGAVVAAFVALAGFVLGAMSATGFVDGQVRRRTGVSPVGLLVVESALLITLPLILAATELQYTTALHAADFVVIAIASVAMGVQAVALRRVGRVAVSTTYGTGAVLRLGEKLALAAKRAPRPDNHPRRLSIAVISIVLASYVAGAFIAALLTPSRWLLLAPAAVPLAAAVALRRSPIGDSSQQEQRADSSDGR